jgi:hypothetical protein
VKKRNTFMMGILLSACWLMAGCSTIDDDLSECGPEEEDFELNYELKLVTNLTTELQTQLRTLTELSVASALETHLENIFTDFAHDVDLSFYDTEGTKEVLEHVTDVIDANQTTYDLTLPMRQYLHLAVANIAENPVVGLTGEKYSYSSELRQAAPTVSDAFPTGVLTSHTTGLFTARQPMEVLGGVSQTFNVHLYMANSAASLVLDTKGQNFTDLKVYATGFAEAFQISDSTYVFPATFPLIKADKVETGNDLLCFCSVNFPSRDAAPASVKKRAGAEPSLWQFKVYLTKPDGKVTETILDISEPLKAGDLRIIKGELDDEGAVRPYNSTVGVSVTLDWNKGGEYDWEM